MMRGLALALGLAACSARAPAPAADCGQCHGAEEREWRASMHHASFTSADFQRSFRAEPAPFCKDCHAPASPEEGIGCPSCHSAPPDHARLAKERAEPRVRVTTRDCAGCHDFDIPGTRVMLQATAREHAESPFASTPCAGCHGGHRFSVRRMLAGALSVGPLRVGEHEAAVTLAARGVGHRFPTGDLFRSVTVTLTAYDRGGALVAGDTFHLRRDWQAHRARRSEDDTRLGGEPREFRIPLTTAAARFHLTVDYIRGAGETGDGDFETITLVDRDLERPKARD